MLPTYLIGLVSAGLFVQEKAVLQRMRTVAFAALTPFYFLKAGLFVSLPAIAAGMGLLAALLAVKVGAKFIGVWPVSRALRLGIRESNYTTLLMSTGLTFGSISALFGLTNGFITQSQYTILVTVVIGSAVLPTLIAQTWSRPRVTTVGPSAATLDQAEVGQALSSKDGSALGVPGGPGGLPASDQAQMGNPQTILEAGKEDG